jgi:FkbM family methyltransferase
MTLSAVNKAAASIRLHFDLFGARGVLKRALFGVCGATNEFRASIPRTSQEILLRLGTTDVAAFQHVFVDNEYGFSLARPPSMIIDAGANVGMSAAYFSLRYPSATILAIEPEPSNFDILRKNAKHFPRIIPINAALWDHLGLVKIHDSGGGHWGMRVVNGASAGAIRSTTITALMKEFDIDQIDLLKLDVEGAECEVLADPWPWIDHVGVICAELHDRFRPGCLKIFETATANFPVKWRQGELHCVARDGLTLADDP